MKCCCFFTTIILTFPVSSRQLQLAVLLTQAFLTSVCHICVYLKRHADGGFAKTNDPNVTFSHHSSVGQGVMTSCLRERMCGSRCFFLHKTIRGVSKITLDITYKQTPAHKKKVLTEPFESSVSFLFFSWHFPKTRNKCFSAKLQPTIPSPYSPCALSSHHTWAFLTI